MVQLYYLPYVEGKGRCVEEKLMNLMILNAIVINFYRMRLVNIDIVVVIE